MPTDARGTHHRVDADRTAVADRLAPAARWRPISGPNAPQGASRAASRHSPGTLSRPSSAFPSRSLPHGTGWSRREAQRLGSTTRIEGSESPRAGGRCPGAVPSVPGSEPHQAAARGPSSAAEAIRVAWAGASQPHPCRACRGPALAPRPHSSIVPEPVPDSTSGHAAYSYPSSLSLFLSFSLALSLSLSLSLPPSLPPSLSACFCVAVSLRTRPQRVDHRSDID